MTLILMGPPGAGKGTQAELIKASYPVTHISTGDMFRDAVQEGTELGLKAKSYMDKGQLVPDEVTIGIVEERLAQPDCKEGFLLDGFPRTTAQAEALDEVMSKQQRRIEAAINISVPEEVLIQRTTGRVSCTRCKSVYHVVFNPPQQSGICDKCGGELIQRSDDEEETARKRLQVYQQQTSPLLDYYEEHGILHNIDGNRDAMQVFADIQEVLASIGKSQ